MYIYVYYILYIHICGLLSLCVDITTERERVAAAEQASHILYHNIYKEQIVKDGVA